MRVATRLVLILLCAVFAAPLRADGRSSMTFDVRLLGLRAGSIEIAASMSENAYSARSRFHSAGLVGLLKRLRADVVVHGTVRDGKLHPKTYAEQIDNGRRVTNVEVLFSPGQPRLVAGDPGSSAPPADASLLREAMDPLTVLYLALRDQSPEEVCHVKADVFDGQRHARFVLNQRQEAGEAITCNGSYRRIAGYGRDEEENRNVAISVTYVWSGAVMRAERVAFDTRLGPAVMERR